MHLIMRHHFWRSGKSVCVCVCVCVWSMTLKCIFLSSTISGGLGSQYVYMSGSMCVCSMTLKCIWLCSTFSGGLRSQCVHMSGSVWVCVFVCGVWHTNVSDYAAPILVIWEVSMCIYLEVCEYGVPQLLPDPLTRFDITCQIYRSNWYAWKLSAFHRTMCKKNYFQKTIQKM